MTDTKTRATIYLTSALTLLCAYQIYYYTKGCLQMGEKYLTLHQIGSQVLAIVPGFLLGCHTITKLQKPETPSHHYWMYISIAYAVVGLLELAFYVKVLLPSPVH